MRNNAMHQYRLGVDLLESSSAKKDQGTLMGMLPMNQQCAFLVPMVYRGALRTAWKITQIYASHP